MFSHVAPGKRIDDMRQVVQNKLLADLHWILVLSKRPCDDMPPSSTVQVSRSIYRLRQTNWHTLRQGRDDSQMCRVLIVTLEPRFPLCIQLVWRELTVAKEKRDVASQTPQNRLARVSSKLKCSEQQSVI